VNRECEEGGFPGDKLAPATLGGDGGIPGTPGRGGVAAGSRNCGVAAGPWPLGCLGGSGRGRVGPRGRVDGITGGLITGDDKDRGNCCMAVGCCTAGAAALTGGGGGGVLVDLVGVGGSVLKSTAVLRRPAALNGCIVGLGWWNPLRISGGTGTGDLPVTVCAAASPTP